MVFTRIDVNQLTRLKTFCCAGQKKSFSSAVAQWQRTQRLQSSALGPQAMPKKLPRFFGIPKPRAVAF